MNVKVFNLISRTNETRYIKWHKTCKWKYRPDAFVCNKKKRSNKVKCRCESKEFIGKGTCVKRFNWKPSICECECDELWDIQEYLDYKICKCRKRLVDKLEEECNENIDEKNLHLTLNDYEKICSSCTVYKVLFLIFFIISISISIVFISFNWYLKRKYIETTIYYIQLHWR